MVSAVHHEWSTRVGAMSAQPTDGDQSSAEPSDGPGSRGSARPAGKAADGEAPDLSILGRTVRHPVDHVECFPAPEGCSTVRFASDELSSLCPVTGQPDLSSIIIEYAPERSCVESKSLKLYLWSFRDRPIFAEALSAAVAREVWTTAAPQWVRVSVTQRPRGGIEVRTTSELGANPPDRSGR